MYPMLSLFSFALVFVLDHPAQMESIPIEEATNDILIETSTMSNANPLTSHVLDTSVGKPAAGLLITLSKFQDGNWRQVSKQETNQDGRVGNLIAENDFVVGTYKLRFDTASYFDSLNLSAFYPFVEVVFDIKNPTEHYHVPILLNPYGYSTYRGS